MERNKYLFHLILSCFRLCYVQVHTFPKACAAVYPSYEQSKVLWFWPNTSPEYKHIAEKEKPPYVPELDDPSYACAMGTRDLHYGCALA